MFTVKHARANTPAAPTGQALKRDLRRKGLSYRTVAKAIGTHASYLSDILNEKRGHPGYALRNRVSEYLKELGQ